jgi:hypothetical protein
MTYKPTVPGSNSAQLVVNSTGGNVTVSLTGVGLAPAKLTATPTSVSFGTIARSTSLVKTFSLSNSGGVPLTISSSTAPTAPYSATGIPANGAVIAAGGTAMVSVTFAPTANGAFLSSVGLVSTGGNLTVALTGTGAAPALLTASPTSLAFGHVAVNGTSSKTVTLTNSGGVSLTFATTTAPPTPFSATGTPSSGSTLAAGATKVVTVTFHPTAANSYSGTLAVNSNAGNVSVPVTGQSP